MQVNKKRILITGGGGFIGSRLAKKLTSDSSVTVFDSFHDQVHAGNPDLRASLNEIPASIIVGDVRDVKALSDVIKASDPHIIYHLAAETGTGQSFDEPARYCDVNIMGTAHLIEAVRAHGKSVERIILAGSRSVYGEGACVDAQGNSAVAVERNEADLRAGDFAPKDLEGRSLTPVATNASCPIAPASVYASTKLMQEYMLQQAFWGTSVKIGILRLQNVYGPGQSLNNPYTGVLSIFTRQILEGKTLDIYEDGEITRDFVLVDDVVEAFVKMGHIDNVPNEIIDIGSGEAATIIEVANALLYLLGEEKGKFTITGKFRPGDIRYAVADISKANKFLSWKPKNTLNNGLAALVAWSKKTLIS